MNTQGMDTDINGIKALSEDAEKAWQNIQELKLETNIAQLYTLGYTVVPPEKVASTSDIREAREKIIELANAQGAALTNYTTYEEGLSYELYHLVKQGRIFEKLAINPTVLTIGRYLLGERMVLNNSLGYVKSKTDKYLRIHSDSLMVPDPLPEYLHLVNFTLALTDYTLEGGCIGIVPGSHRCRRHPTTPEETYYEVMQPIVCPAGSLIVIPGNTWHGAFPKSTPDLRVTLVQAYCRQYFTPSVSHKISQDIIDRNPPEFAQIMGGNIWTGFDEKGMSLDKFAASYRTQHSHYA